MDEYNAISQGDRSYCIEISIQMDEFKGKLRSKPFLSDKVGLSVVKSVNRDIIYHLDGYECIDCDLELCKDEPNKFRYNLLSDYNLWASGTEYCCNFYKFIIGINIVECDYFGVIE